MSLSSPGVSRPVSSNQTGIHEDLEHWVLAYQRTPFRKPIAPFNREAFATAQRWLADHAGPWIMDSGCGVGESTRQLARRYPDHLVIGLDRSADRLSRQYDDTPDNARFLRTDLVDFWRLAAEAGWQPERHYLLYPNPYPKKQHLKQRWHGHPVFPSLIHLGGELECRSNWSIYLDELASALALYGINACINPIEDSPALTHFERKYRASGQSVWSLQASIPRANSPADTLRAPRPD